MNTKKKLRKGESIASSIAPSENDALARDLAQYVTTEVAAEMLGVSPNHIRLLLGRNKIRGIKLGHDWIVFVPSLVRYNEAKSRKGRPALKAPESEPTR